MANRYGCLPSELIRNGDTLDLDVYMTITNITDREDRKRKGENITDNYDQDYLEEIYNNVRN